jgi:hypothetical protein
VNKLQAEQIGELISGGYQIKGLTLSANAIQIMLHILKVHEHQELLTAINQCLCKGLLPDISNINSCLKKRDGFLESDEAWGCAIEAMDESASVFWTDEMAEAYGAALPLFEIGDKTGARMAFKQRYERLVEESRTNGKKIRWWISYGDDVQRRHEAIQLALQVGVISEEKCEKLLIQHGAKPPSKEGLKLISGLTQKITGKDNGLVCLH